MEMFASPSAFDAGEHDLRPVGRPRGIEAPERVRIGEGASHAGVIGGSCAELPSAFTTQISLWVFGGASRARSGFRRATPRRARPGGPAATPAAARIHRGWSRRFRWHHHRSIGRTRVACRRASSRSGMSSPQGCRVTLETTSGDTDRVDAVQGRIAHAIALAGDPLAVGRPCSATECLQLPFRLRQVRTMAPVSGSTKCAGIPSSQQLIWISVPDGAQGPPIAPRRTAAPRRSIGVHRVRDGLSSRGHRARTRSGRRPRTHPSPSAVPIGCHQRRSRRRRRRRGRANRGSIRALQSTIAVNALRFATAASSWEDLRAGHSRERWRVESDREGCPQPSSAITDSGMSKFA